MSKRVGDLKVGDTVKLGNEKMKVTDVRKDGDRAAVSLQGKGSRAEHSGSVDDEIGE